MPDANHKCIIVTTSLAKIVGLTHAAPYDRRAPSACAHPCHLSEAREWQLSPEARVGIATLTALEIESLPVLATLWTDFSRSRLAILFARSRIISFVVDTQER